MRHIFISIMIFISGVITSQECKIDLHSLAHPDFNLIQLNKFGQSRLFKIVVSEDFDTIAYKEIIDHLSQWFLNQNSRINIVNIKDVEKLLKLMDGFSGAEVKAVCTEGGYFAIRENRTTVTQKDLIDATTKVRLSMEQEGKDYMNMFG